MAVAVDEARHSISDSGTTSPGGAAQDQRASLLAQPQTSRVIERRSRRSAHSMTASAAAIRLRALKLIGERTFREIASQTGYNRETVRRYCTLGGFGGDWLARLTEVYGANGHWLLTGDGPVHLQNGRATGLSGRQARGLDSELAQVIEGKERLPKARHASPRSSSTAGSERPSGRNQRKRPSS